MTSLCCIYDTYEYMLNIIETLEDKINYLELHVLNSLQTKVKMNNNYIELLETKLEKQFIKNDELNGSIISLEAKLKKQMDELFSITYSQSKILIPDIKITNSIVQFFEDKLEIEFAKNDDLRREIVVLENKLIKETIVQDIPTDLSSCGKTVIKAFNIALGI